MNIIPYSKFKHGQRVTCEINGVKIDDAKISIDSDGTVYICQNISSLYSAQNKLGYKKSYRILYKNMNFDWNDYVSNLKFLPHTLDDLEEGDVVVNQYGGERKVLGKCGEVYFLSLRDNFGSAWGTMTISDMKEYKYTLKQDIEEPEEGKLDLRSPEAEKMREEARSKRWEFVPSIDENFSAGYFSWDFIQNNTIKLRWKKDVVDICNWNIGCVKRTDEEALAWGEKYARYFLTE